MNNIRKIIPALLCTKTCDFASSRGHVILKRKYPIRLHKKNEEPKRFRTKDFIYEPVRYTDHEKKPNIDVILTSYVEGLGQAGDQVSVRPFSGYDNLLMPGLAVYATPENIEKYSGLASSRIGIVHSSKYSSKTLKMLKQHVVGIPLNDSHPWTLEPWHIQAGFRLSGIILPTSAIEMPPHAITGPHKEQHRKEFYVTVTMSETERTKVRCRIYLTGIYTDAVPEADWMDPADPLFEEDREILDSLPKIADLPNFDALKIKYNKC